MPIDEMLIDLRAALEALEDNPCTDCFDAVLRETMRIERFCEDIPEEEVWKN